FGCVLRRPRIPFAGTLARLPGRPAFPSWRSFPRDRWPGEAILSVHLSPFALTAFARSTLVYWEKRLSLACVPSRELKGSLLRFCADCRACDGKLQATGDRGGVPA